jgi:hypothetical protein
VAAVALALAAVAIGAAVPVQAGTDPSLYAWVTVVQQPKTGTFIPGQGDQGNGSGNKNSITRKGPGLYEVTFPGVGYDPCGGTEPYGCVGTFTVTAFSSRQRICTGGNPEIGTGPDHAATTFVDCRGPDGKRHDSGFTVSYLAVREHPGRVAYLVADDPLDDGYIPSKPTNHAQDLASYNTSGRTGTGRYRIWLDGVEADAGGNVQLTSTDGWCTVTGREHEIMTTSYVLVACRDWTGHLVDTIFNVRFTQNVGIEAQFGDGPAAYLWADQPKAASYHPSAAFRHSSVDRVPTIKRLDVGRYLVKLPGMPAHGVAHVTPYGSGSARCQLTSIRTNGTPQRIGVRCFRPGGRPADSAFYLTYAR